MNRLVGATLWAIASLFFALGSIALGVYLLIRYGRDEFISALPYLWASLIFLAIIILGSVGAAGALQLPIWKAPWEEEI